MAVDVSPRSRPDQPGRTARPETAGWRPMVARGALVGAVFLAAAVVMAFPSITRFRTAVPGDYGDAFLSRWLLQWDVHALFHSSHSVFSPNIFWPFGNTLVYSDTGLATAPVSAVLSTFLSWTVVFNTIYLACWVASQVFTYLLARWVGATRAAAVLAAFAFSFGAVRLGHYVHFQLLFGCLAPLDVLLMVAFLEQRRWWQAVLLGFGCAAIFLNAGYIAVVVFPVLVVVAGGWLIAEHFHPGPRFYSGLAVAGVIALALTFPVLRVFRQEGSLLNRPYVQDQVVTPKNFLSPGVGSLLYGGLERTFVSDFENKLFPGFIALALGLVGGGALVATRRRRAQPAPDPRPDPDPEPTPTTPATASARDDPAPDALRRRALLLVLLGVLPALIMAFGKYQFVAGHKIELPYRVIGLLPGYKSIRAFGRFTVVPLLGLALLAAVGFDYLLRHRTAVLRTGVATAVAVAMLLEYKIQIQMAPTITDPQLTAVNYALAKLPNGPVLELPMGDTRNQDWAYVEAPREVLSTIDWKPRVNGYSGYSPPGYEHEIDVFNGLANPAPADAMPLLDQLGVRYIVIRTASADPQLAIAGVTYDDPATAARIVAALPASRVESVTPAGAAVLIRLRPPP